MDTTTDHPDLEKLPLEIDGIAVCETIREIFRNPDNGTPDNISKAGCLALSMKSNDLGGRDKGYVIWNAWRRVFPVDAMTRKNRADFQEHEFLEDALFLGYDFGLSANFSKAIFRKRAYFIGARFGSSTDFSFSFWAGEAHFQFSLWAADIRFEHAYWTKHAVFIGSQWIGANFTGWMAPEGLSFAGVGCTNVIGLSCSKIHQLDASAESWAWLETRCYWVIDGVRAYARAKSYAKEIGSDPECFSLAFFSGTHFLANVNFANRKFNKGVFFDAVEKHNPWNEILRQPDGLPLLDRNDIPQHIDDKKLAHFTRFTAVPIFHGCELHQDTSFDGAEFPKPTGDDKAIRAYRTLKLAFNKQQAVREEQRFFRLEMEEETLRETGMKRWLFKAYKTFSDYGFSITKPLKYWGSGVLALTAVYGLLSWLGQCGLSVQACNLAPEWLEFSLLQTLPLPGLDKLSENARKAFWPEGAWWGLLLSALVIVHKTSSLASLFLIGLALRNLFKLK